VSGQKLLIDTNILLAAVIEPERLPGGVQAELRDPECEVLFSAASVWEIAIKTSLGRRDFSFLPDEVHRLALDTGFTELPIAAAHASAVARLPWHHHDPFDRLLVAQAQALPAYLLTSDAFLARYSELVRPVTLSRP
jgi:PIN domain nuclease of toxin-antitoxin system